VKREKQRGYHDYCSNGPLLAVVWFDCKFVCFINTMHSATMNGDLQTIMRRNKDGTQEAVRCSPLLHDYQQHIGCGSWRSDDRLLQYGPQIM